MYAIALRFAHLITYVDNSDQLWYFQLPVSCKVTLSIVRCSLNINDHAEEQVQLITFFQAARTKTT